MALMALVLRGAKDPARARVLMLLGLFGAALFLRRRHDHAGDLGAVGGRGSRGRHTRVQAVRHSDHAGRDPAAVRLPEARHGSASGRWFGPIMVVWFVALAVLGMIGIARAPQVLAALNPLLRGRVPRRRTARRGSSRWVRWCWWLPAPRRCTRTWGISAPTPIRIAWTGLVLPALALNYFGQGALLLGDPQGDRKSVLPARTGVGALSRWSRSRPWRRSSRRRR